MRKQIMAVLLALVMFALCGCNADTPKTTTGAQPAGTTAPSQTVPATTLGGQQIPTTAAPVPTTVAPVPTTTVPAPTTPNISLDPVNDESMARYRYTLMEVCSFPKEKHSTFSRQMPVVRKTEDGVLVDYLHSYTGELLISEGCRGYDYFGNGLTAMYSDSVTRLVNVFTGQRYFEDAAVLQIRQMNSRFYYVIYKEYGLVYDLENGSFMKELKVTDMTLSAIPRAIGDTVFERVEFGKYRAHLADGTVTEFSGVTAFTQVGFLRTVGEDTEVYDSNCNLMTTVKGGKTIADYGRENANDCCWKYYKTGEYKSYTVVDINGKQLLPDVYTAVYAYGDYLVVTNTQEQQALYLADGTQVLDFQYKQIFRNSECGVFTLTTLDGKSQIYVPGGSVVTLDPLRVSSEYVRDGKNYLMLATGEVRLLENAHELYHGLIRCDGGVIETYSGTTVLEPGFTSVVATDEYIYVCRDGLWHVYQFELVKD